MSEQTLVARLRERASHARQVHEALPIHTKGKSGYDVQLDEEAAARIEALPISAEDKALIQSGNAESIFGLG